MDLVNLNSFLKFGYFLDYKNPNITFDFSGIDKEKYKNVTEDELVDIGIKLWKEAIQKQFKPNEKHVVPLSGGLDSRAILAGLLEFTEAKNIYTYTFGSPGTLDYDIGNSIAKKVGTNHTKFPLTEHKYTIEEEIDISKRINHQTILFHHAPIWKLDEMFTGHKIWSGFLGDTVGGSHTPKVYTNDVDSAKIFFIKNNTYTNSINLSNCSDLEFHKYLQYDSNCLNKICIEDNINLLNGEINSVAPYLLIKDFRYAVPHLEYKYLNFMFSIPECLRLNQNLYNKILFNAFPKLFKLKLKSRNYSRIQILNRKAINKIKQSFNLVYPYFINPNINYLDFNYAIRNKRDLRKIIYESIMDLKHRKIVDWIDIDEIWKRHINKRANHADALLVLASLEIHLKAGKKI